MRIQLRPMMAFVAAGMATAAVAGPINPPAGPITSTYKTLSEIEPRIAINATNTPGDNDATPSLFKITQPGSYYLTGNVSAVFQPGKIGIEIAVSNVTVDLNGFTVSGATATLDGIAATGSGLEGIRIQNGTVRNWTKSGISLNGTEGTVLRDLHATNNTLDGIAAGAAAIIQNCTATANMRDGISVDSGASISACAAKDNGSRGFYLGEFSTIEMSTATLNSLGIGAADGCVVRDCTASDNVNSGVGVGTNGVVSGTSAFRNGMHGITLGTSSLATGNQCRQNGIGAGTGAGIHVSSSIDTCRIEANSCVGNDVGVLVQGTRNVLLRNTCANNTLNWNIGSGNTFLIVQAPTSSGVMGNAGGSGYGTTDPNANITY